MSWKLAPAQKVASTGAAVAVKELTTTGNA
jgi:hypothetical protein